MTRDRSICRTRLDNGLTLVTEEIPTVRSATLGIWVKMGSRFEAPDQAGISHFIEHMLFKGTEERTTKQIAFEIDAMGGQLDAFTTKEHACYYATVLDVHVKDAFELVSDIVLNPLFEEEELERERAVILEELAAVEDSPEDYLWEEFSRNFWPDHPLGTSILGLRETIEALTREDLAIFFRRAYEPANVVIAAAGHFEHDALLSRVVETFGDLENESQSLEVSTPTPRQHFSIVSWEELEQVHIAVGAPGVSAVDERRYAAFLLNAVLGGSVSSRLFQRVREEQGLAYNVYSSLESFSDGGCFWIYAATRTEAAATALELLLEELGVLQELPVPEEELSRMKENLKGNVMLGLESTSGRMSSLAQQEIYFGRAFEMDEILESIDVVSAEEVQELARELFEDDAIAIDVLARRSASRELTGRFADGLALPGGKLLAPTG